MKCYIQDTYNKKYHWYDLCEHSSLRDAAALFELVTGEVNKLCVTGDARSTRQLYTEIYKNLLIQILI